MLGPIGEEGLWFRLSRPLWVELVWVDEWSNHSNFHHASVFNALMPLLWLTSSSSVLCSIQTLKNWKLSFPIWTIDCNPVTKGRLQKSPRNIRQILHLSDSRRVSCITVAAITTDCLTRAETCVCGYTGAKKTEWIDSQLWRL